MFCSFGSPCSQCVRFADKALVEERLQVGAATVDVVIGVPLPAGTKERLTNQFRGGAAALGRGVYLLLLSPSASQTRTWP